MKKNTVILFYPKTEKENLNKNLPFAIMKLGSELKGMGYDLVAIDERFDEDYEDLLSNALEEAVFFGVSVMTGYQIHGGLRASAFVRRSGRNVPIVWGGWHPSILPEETLRNSNIDIVVRGQGEGTICDLAKTLQNGSDLDSIEGISYKKDGGVISNGSREMRNVNSFQPIRFDVLDIERYIFKSPLGERSILWNSSQGCPYRCGFCSTPAVYRRKWSGLSAQTLIEQLKTLVDRYGIDGVTFAEDNFFVDVGRIEKLCEALIKNGLNLKWASDVRVDMIIRFPGSFLKLLKESGCSKLYVGAESGDQDMLDLMNKMIKLEDTFKAAELLDRHKIISEFFIIVGFPEDPEKDLKKSLELIKRIKSKYPAHQFSVYMYTPYPGTPLLDVAMKSGLKIPDKLEGWVRWSILSINTPWVDSRYLDRVSMYSKCVYPLAYPSPSLRSKFDKGLKGLPYRLLHRIAMFRVDKDFFGFCLEWQLVKAFHKLNMRFRIFKDIESFR